MSNTIWFWLLFFSGVSYAEDSLCVGFEKNFVFVVVVVQLGERNQPQNKRGNIDRIVKPKINQHHHRNQKKKRINK